MKRASTSFDINCVECSRLAGFLKTVKQQYPDYYAKPVAPFGVARPKLLIVGLAPGMHGANASGRPFTGDHAGILLYKMLYKHGFSNQPISQHQNDSLKLIDCRITNAVKCLPPGNKPTGSEIATCNRYLKAELELTAKHAVYLCLGQISHKAVVKALGLRQSDIPFQHGRAHWLENGKTIVDSYHCSRYNTQTRRLTEAMFDDIFRHIREELV